MLQAAIFLALVAALVYYYFQKHGTTDSRGLDEFIEKFKNFEP